MYLSVCFLPVMIEMLIFGTCSITSMPAQIYLAKEQLNTKTLEIKAWRDRQQKINLNFRAVGL